MKLLLDANISWRLADRLRPYIGDCIHVDTTGLPSPATDIDSWNFAHKNGYIIVTNDDDFLNFIDTKGFPPKIILLRTGNQSNSYIEELLIRHLEDIKNLAETTDYGVLEIF